MCVFLDTQPCPVHPMDFVFRHEQSRAVSVGRLEEAALGSPVAGPPLLPKEEGEAPRAPHQSGALLVSPEKSFLTSSSCLESGPGPGSPGQVGCTEGLFSLRGCVHSSASSGKTQGGRRPGIRRLRAGEQRPLEGSPTPGPELLPGQTPGSAVNQLTGDLKALTRFSVVAGYQAMGGSEQRWTCAHPIKNSFCSWPTSITKGTVSLT